MTFRVRVLPRAEYDVQDLYSFISQGSADGAASWYAAFRKALRELPRNPEGYSLAPENDDFDSELRQFLFKTRRGLTYRGIFTVVDDEISVLRVRGFGQPPITRGDVE